MMLTRDNLLRFVVEKKFVTTTDVAERFETSTMIASAALSELSKDKKVAITDLKLGSTPYYYDPNQRECLIEIGEKHLKNHERNVFVKLKGQQIVNDGGLPIAERLAAGRITDFCQPLEIFFEGKQMKFWVWFLRDLDETRTQILEALSGNSKSKEEKKVETKTETKKPDKKKVETKKVVEEKVIEKEVIEPKVEKKRVEPKVDEKKIVRQADEFKARFEAPSDDDFEEDRIEKFIRSYFKKNYMKVDGKKTTEKFVKYNLSLKVNSIVIKFDAVYFVKKPKDEEILKFYMSGNKPKIIFIENAAKKHFKFSETLDNLEIVNI